MLGHIPDAGGIHLLTRALGPKTSTAPCIDAGPMGTDDDAMVLGIVNEVIEDDDEFAEAVTKKAKKFTYGPAASYKYIKELVYESEFKGFDDYVKMEVDAQMACGATDDFAEGVSAFVEKRRASFA